MTTLITRTSCPAGRERNWTLVSEYVKAIGRSETCIRFAKENLKKKRVGQGFSGLKLINHTREETLGIIPVHIGHIQSDNWSFRADIAGTFQARSILVIKRNRFCHTRKSFELKEKKSGLPS